MPPLTYTNKCFVSFFMILFAYFGLAQIHCLLLLLLLLLLIQELSGKGFIDN